MSDAMSDEAMCSLIDALLGYYKRDIESALKHRTDRKLKQLECEGKKGIVATILEYGGITYDDFFNIVQEEINDRQSNKSKGTAYSYKKFPTHFTD